MIKFERLEVSGFANALYGMRLPKVSHHLSDTTCLVYDFNDNNVKNKTLNEITSDDKVIEVNVGGNDDDLAKRLVLAGTDHGKWLRQVQISVLITAPMTFWWDFDTYKVATVKNSSSRMHKITSRNLTEDDFTWDDEDGELVLTPFREQTLLHLNKLIDMYNSEKNSEEKKKIFRELIQDIPDSYNFTAMWTGSAQTARNYYFARRHHKQQELRKLAEMFGNIKCVGKYITLDNIKDDSKENPYKFL